MKQVEIGHYSFDKYVKLDRWSSYYYQIMEVLALSPGSMLEIGTGDGFLKNYIKGNTDVNYKNLDVAEDLSPDIVGSVDKIPLQDKSFDLTCAFEVLEHLPFEKFETALKELGRVSKKHVIISLPHFGPPVKVLIKIPFLPEIRLAFKIPWPREHTFNGEHYWEIGKRGYSPAKIRGALARHFSVKKEFVPFENQYHRFFILEKR